MAEKNSILGWVGFVIFLVFFLSLAKLAIEDFYEFRYTLEKACPDGTSLDSYKYGYWGNSTQGTCNRLVNNGYWACGYKIKCNGKVQSGFYKIHTICTDSDEWGECKEIGYILQ